MSAVRFAKRLDPRPRSRSADMAVRNSFGLVASGRCSLAFQQTALMVPPLMRAAFHSTWLLLHALFTGMGAGQSLPVPGVLWLAHERADSINCMNQLKQIGLAARLWQIENGGSFPSGFSVLTNELEAPAVLFCPSNYRREPAATNWNGFAWSSIDYEWITPTNPADPSAVFCRCKIHRNTGRIDGSADFVLGVNPGWPRILAPPLSQWASIGSLVRFEFVLTNAAEPFHIQWNREDPYWRTNVVFVITNEESGEGYWRTNYLGTNTPIAGATNAVFVIASATTNDAGFYSVTISNALGTAKIGLHRLSVPQPQTLIPMAELLCRNRLRMISLAANLWGTEHGDNFPLSLGEMTNDLGYPLFGWPILLFCPADTNRFAPTNWTSVDFSDTSYEIVRTNSAPQEYDEPFARCRVHGFVVSGYGTIRPAVTVMADPQRSANGQFTFTVRDSANGSFAIQASTNFVDWTDLMTVTNGVGKIPFTDLDTNFTRRFYRARQLP